MRFVIKGVLIIIALYTLAALLASSIAKAEEPCEVRAGYRLVQTLFVNPSSANFYGGWLVMKSDEGREGLRFCMATVGELDVVCYKGTGIKGIVDGRPLGEKFERVSATIPAPEEFCEVES